MRRYWVAGVFAFFAGIIFLGHLLPGPMAPGRGFLSTFQTLLTARQAAQPEAAARPKVNEAYGHLPLHFEANQGQTDPRVKYLSRGKGYALFLTQKETVLVLSPNSSQNSKSGLSEGSVLRIRLKGGNARRLEGIEKLKASTSYFIGAERSKWRRAVPLYAKVKAQKVYPGIDMVYYGSLSGQLEYDFIVSPGSHLKDIRMTYEGARKVEVDGKGNLVLKVGQGEVVFKAPVLYQVKKGQREPLKGRYAATGNGQVGFEVDSYDPTRVLVIDPSLDYSTYLGGSDNDTGRAIAVDSSGNAYVAGYTASTNFPTTSGVFQTTNKGSSNVFVTKVNSTGTNLIYSTYIGGSGTEQCFAIAVDSGGNAYVTGYTTSTDYPTTAGVTQTVNGGGTDAFVTKLNAAGTSLIYSTYLGGSGNDYGYGVAVDSGGNAYVTGFTTSTNFPTIPGSFQTANGGGQDSFVTKVNPTGTALVYSTYLGGSSTEGGYAIAVDSSGDAIVTGDTFSTNFPTTAGAYQTIHGGSNDAYITKLNPAGTGLLYSSYLGGSGGEYGFGIKVDPLGFIYVTGYTSGNFPTTAGAFQTVYGGGNSDAYVAKLNPAGGGASDLIYSTYLGGNGGIGDAGYAIAIDSSGNAYVTGDTYSTNFPITKDAYQPTNHGSEDGTFFILNSAGTSLIYSTYLGGSGNELSYSIALDFSNNAYVAGWTTSPDFPTTVTVGVTQTAFGGVIDTFVAKFSTASPFDLAVPGQTFLYPSPATGSTATVAYYMNNPGNVKIKVWNATVELVGEVDEAKGAGAQTSRLSVGKYAPGVYFYRVQMEYGGGATEVLPLKKFVVRR